jgi:hypothetical protein
MPMTFLRHRVVDERLCLTTAAECVPHGADRREHGGRGIDGVATLLEDHRAGGGAEWFAGDGDPVFAVQRRAFGALGVGGRREDGQTEGDQSETEGAGESHRGWERGIGTI